MWISVILLPLSGPSPLSDVLVDKGGSTPEDKVLELESNDGVGQVFCELNEQQQSVLSYRFGLLGDPPLTLQETGERIGVSRERVRQIECQAKARMRRLFFKKRRASTALDRPFDSSTVRRMEQASNSTH